MIIFDFDGVIADSLEAHLCAYQKVFQKFGKTLDMSDSASWRMRYDSAWENNFYRCGFSEQEMREALEVYFDFIDYRSIPLFDPLAEIVKRLSNKYRLAVASTTDTKIIKERLAMDNLDHYFEQILGSSESSNKTQKLAKILEFTELTPETCLMIGDTSSDIRAAKSNRIKSIAVSYGFYAHERLLSENPDALVACPAELEEKISSLLT